MTFQVRRELGVLLGLHGVAGREEGVLRRSEAVPQLVVVLAGSAACSTPAVHQPLEGGGGRTPVARVPQRLGLLDQGLLDRLGLGVGLVQVREVLSPLAVERRPGVAEALPQLVLGPPVETDRVRLRAALLLGAPGVESSFIRWPSARHWVRSAGTAAIFSASSTSAVRRARTSSRALVSIASASRRR